MIEPVICPHHLGLALRQHEQREDDLREAAEADGQQPADGGADVLGQLLRGPAHPIGQHRDA